MNANTIVDINNPMPETDFSNRRETNRRLVRNSVEIKDASIASLRESVYAVGDKGLPFINAIKDGVHYTFTAVCVGDDGYDYKLSTISEKYKQKKP